MRKFQIYWAMLLVCGTSAYSQLLLTNSETWSYQFSTLPYTGMVSAFTANPQGSFQFTVNSASWQPQSRLYYEMFENNTGEAAIASGTLSSVPPFGAACQALGNWQDRQGAIRFTMQGGSAIVDSITLQAIESGPSLSSYDVYSETFVPAPEPGTCVLLGAAFGMGLLWKLRRRVRF